MNILKYISDCNNAYKRKTTLRKTGIILLFVPLIVAFAVMLVAAILSVFSEIKGPIPAASMLMHCSLLAPVLGIVMILRSKKKYKNAKNVSKYVIHSYGRQSPEDIYEEVGITVGDDGYYFYTVAQYDRFNGGGHSEKVPDEFVSNGDVDTDSLLLYIAGKYPYMSSLKKERSDF